MKKSTSGRAGPVRAWIREGKAAVLKVPSVLVPDAANLVLNPRHPEARKVRIGPAGTFSFDPRMWK